MQFDLVDQAGGSSVRPRSRSGGALGSGLNRMSSKEPRGSSHAPTSSSRVEVVVVEGPITAASSSTTTQDRPTANVGVNEDRSGISFQWCVILRAALDPSISTQALRLAAGMHSDVSGLAARHEENGGVAYIDNPKARALTGLDHKTIRQVEREVTSRIGLIGQVSRGRRRLLADKDVGEAGGWIVLDPIPQKHVLAPNLDLDGAATILDPSRACWSEGRHVLWRLAVCLVATRGLPVLATVASIRTSDICGLLGISKNNVARVRRDLANALAASDADPYAGSDETTRRSKWIEGRKVARGDELPVPRETAPSRPPEVPWRDAMAAAEDAILAREPVTSPLVAARVPIDNPLSYWQVVEACRHIGEESVTIGDRTFPAVAVLEDEDGVRCLLHTGDIPTHFWARNALPEGVGYLVEPRVPGQVVAVRVADFIRNRHEDDHILRIDPRIGYPFTALPTVRDLCQAERDGRTSA